VWWLSVWIEVQIVCIWSSRCHCHPKTPSSLASLKSRLVLPFWYWLTQVVLEMRQLNWCSSCYSCCNTLPDNNQKKQLWTLSFLMPEERDIYDSTDACNEYGRSAVKKLTTGSLTFSLSAWQFPSELFDCIKSEYSQTHLSDHEAQYPVIHSIIIYRQVISI